MEPRNEEAEKEKPLNKKVGSDQTRQQPNKKQGNQQQSQPQRQQQPKNNNNNNNTKNNNQKVVYIRSSDLQQQQKIGEETQQPVPQQKPLKLPTQLPEQKLEKAEKKERSEKQEFKPKSNNGGTVINRSENPSRKSNSRNNNNSNSSNNNEKDNTIKNNRIDETGNPQSLPQGRSLQEKRKDREEERKQRENALKRRIEQQGGEDSDNDGGEEEAKDEIDMQKASKNEVREALTKRLKRKQIDCPICYEKIGIKAAIWSCVQCYHPFHLECLKKWIHNSNKTTSNTNIANSHSNNGVSNTNSNTKNQGHHNKLLTWSCPNCQYLYSDNMPTYLCFCSKFHNPEFDSQMTPHSCGDNCGKKRGQNCTHPCDILCHPGPCPPCPLRGEPIRCYCNKQKREILCSDGTTAFECGATCGKKLNCGNHTCKKSCHPGDCGKCTEIVEAFCFCEKENKRAICGEHLFSCNRPCNKTLSCGNHKCLQTCHPGSCEECHLGPDEVDTCPCGKISLLTLTGGNFRESCADPIPICGGPCKKIAACGVHICKRSCHEGPCPPCKEPVEEICRCSFTSRIVQCYELREPDHTPFLCDRVCKKLKSCHVHPCNTTCCPARKGQDLQNVHLCLKVCEKPLPCGKHNCELFCHLGICNKCPMRINEPISCVCGKTTLAPPQPCGTKLPECTFPCSRKKECGHPCHLDCHPDECPPCEFKVDKICHCGRQTVQGVSCSKEALCTTPCNKVMSCGHKCDTVCHIGDCPKDNIETGCGRVCNRKRKFCDHKCFALCHGQEECPPEPCKVEVVVKCKCGEREAFVECGAFDCVLDLSLACSGLCKNMSRFSRFHEKGKIGYSATLTRFARAHLAYLLKIEKKVEMFIKSNDSEMIIPFENDVTKKQSLQQLLGKHYHINIQYYSHSKTPYFCIDRGITNMSIPKTLLSEYYKKVEKGDIRPEISPFEVSLTFSPSTKLEHNQGQLDLILRDFLKDFYLELEERVFAIHFWDKIKADMAQKKLKKSNSIYSVYTLEYNERLQKEEESLRIAPSDITRAPRQIIVPVVVQAPEHSDDEDKNILKQDVQSQREYFSPIARLYNMCSDKEITERQQRKLIDIFEQDPRAIGVECISKWMVKAYLRTSESNTQPENIRPPDVLLSTTKYIVKRVLDANFYLNVPFKYPKESENSSKRRSHTFADVFNFSTDRFKAIRQDITILKEATEESTYALEMICRFYALCFYECQSIPSCDYKILRDDFGSSLSQLIDMYDQLQGKYKYVENQYEIYTYTLLLHAQNPVFLNSFLAQIPNIDNPSIRKALRIIDAVDKLDYYQFFKVVKELTYLECCVVFPLFTYIRSHAINAMKRARLALTVKDFQEILFFDSAEQTLEYLKSEGCDISKLTAEIEYETDEEEEAKLVQKEKELQDNKNQNNDKDSEQNITEKITDGVDIIQEKKQDDLVSQPVNTEVTQNETQPEKSEIKTDQDLNPSQTEGATVKVERPKIMKVKKVYIDWKTWSERKEGAFVELNSMITDKKTISHYPDYRQTKPTNNDQIVTRAFLVMGPRDASSALKENKKETQQVLTWR